MTFAARQARNLPEVYSIALSSKANLKAIPGIEIAAASVFSEADLPLHIRYRITDHDVLEHAWRGGRLWIALEGADHVVGFAMLEIVDGQAHLDEMDVHPDHAGQGIGSNLLWVATDWAVDEGYSALTLVTFRHLAWNAPYYQKLGFKEIDSDDLNSELRDILQHEADAGLNSRNRVAMQLPLK